MIPDAATSASTVTGAPDGRVSDSAAIRLGVILAVAAAILVGGMAWFGAHRAAPLEPLLAARRALVREAAPLHARYGLGGTFTAQREIRRAELAIDMRTRMEGEGRVTQAMIDEAVSTHPAYMALIAEAEAERARLYVYYDEIRAANARIVEHFARLRTGATEGLGEIGADPDAAA